MGILQRFRGADHSDKKARDTTGSNTSPAAEEHADLEKEAGEPLDNSHVRIFTVRVFLMGIIVSIGGLIFGYDTGQISGMFVAYNTATKFLTQLFQDSLRCPTLSTLLRTQQRMADLPSVTADREP